MNKYNLILLFQQIIEIASSVEEFSTEELWEWTVFDKENTYLNDILEIHEYSNVPIKGRKEKLDDCLEISGDVLLFNYIPHLPLMKIQVLDNVQSLRNEILSNKGILNSFTGLQIPIIKGKAIDILSILRYKSDNPNIIFDLELKNELLEFLDKIEKYSIE